MFVHSTKRTKYLVRVCSFIKRMNTNELSVERFTNCSLNVQFVCSPNYYIYTQSDNKPWYMSAFFETVVAVRPIHHYPTSYYRSTWSQWD
ncbi:hypothetical protein Hanom_Chr09g00783901 [Helianthus anomalus]